MQKSDCTLQENGVSYVTVTSEYIASFGPVELKVMTHALGGKGVKGPTVARL